MSVLQHIARRGRQAIRRFSLPPHTVVFLHIPKTGGMSLHEVLLRESRGKPTFWIADPVKDLEWLTTFPEEERERWTLVEGHMYYGVHERLPRPCVYMTMLRDPVERVLSYYSHVQERPDHHLHQAARGLSIGECIRRGLTVEMDNFMVRALTRVENANLPFGGVTQQLLREAMANLQRVKLLGLTERFSESLVYFGRELAWKGTDVPRVNVTRRRVRREEVGTDVELVQEANRLDAELYRFAVELFEKRMRRTP
jgi:hypothetical protein